MYSPLIQPVVRRVSSTGYPSCWAITIPSALSRWVNTRYDSSAVAAAFQTSVRSSISSGDTLADATLTPSSVASPVNSAPTGTSYGGGANSRSVCSST